MPASLLNATALNALPIFIGAAFGGSVLGLWSLAMRVLSAPMALIAQSVGAVFYQKAVVVRDSSATLGALYLHVVRRLALRGGLYILVVLLLATNWQCGPFSACLRFGACREHVAERPTGARAVEWSRQVLERLDRVRVWPVGGSEFQRAEVSGDQP